MMSFVNIFLIAMLGILNIQQSRVQSLNDLNNNNLIDNFLSNFPNATDIQNEDELNVKSNTAIKYTFPVIGTLLNYLIPDDGVEFSTITIAGKSFLGGSTEILVLADNRTVRFGNRLGLRNRTFITDRIISSGSNKRQGIDAIEVLAGLSFGPTGYTLNNLRIQFVNFEPEISYSISPSDRAVGGRIKNWLSNELPVVVDKYQEYIDNLTTVRILNLTDSLL